VDRAIPQIQNLKRWVGGGVPEKERYFEKTRVQIFWMDRIGNHRGYRRKRRGRGLNRSGSGFLPGGQIGGLNQKWVGALGRGGM